MNANPDGNQDDLEKPPPWLVTFGDATALMLTFFVMLFAMSQIQSEKWDALVERFYIADIRPPSEDPLPTEDQSIATVDLRPALSTDYLDRIMREALARDGVLADSTITRLSDRLVVSLPSEALFPNGGDVLLEPAREAVFRLGVFLAQIGNQVEVLGHTDPGAALFGDFDDDWALALARALAVARELARSGYGRTLEIAGHGNGHFRHLDPALDEAARVRLANRVDLVIHPQSENQR